VELRVRRGTHWQTQLRLCFVWFSPLVRLMRVRYDDWDA
jgi:hypothetical protein